MADRTNVFDLEGRPMGATDEPEKLFLHHVRLLTHTKEVYVVSGPGGSDEFKAGLEEIGVPLIEDPRIGERAIILEGSPLEWEHIAGDATEWADELSDGRGAAE